MTEPEHGTYARYQQEKKAGETCEACRAANVAYAKKLKREGAARRPCSRCHVVVTRRKDGICQPCTTAAAQAKRKQAPEPTVERPCICGAAEAEPDSDLCTHCAAAAIDKESPYDLDDTHRIVIIGGIVRWNDETKHVPESTEGHTHVCKGCGGGFTPKGNAQRYCSEACRRATSRARQKAGQKEVAA